MNAYETKRQARIERMRGRAEALAIEAEALRARDRSLLDCMAGTPVLIGHHSQRRHERDLDKLHRNMGRRVEMTREAEALEVRAARAEASGAVYSDDPEALEKLRVKLAEAEAFADRVATSIKQGRRLGSDVAEMRTAGLEPDVCRFVEFMGFLPTNANNRAEVARLKARIATLETAAQRVPVADETIGDVVISESDNRVRLTFPGKPQAATIAALKSRGFRWSPSAGVWQRHASPGAWAAAREVARG